MHLIKQMLNRMHKLGQRDLVYSKTPDISIELRIIDAASLINKAFKIMLCFMTMSSVLYLSQIYPLLL